MRLIVVLFAIVLSGCSGKQDLETYAQLVAETDQVQMKVLSTGQEIALTTAEVNAFKVLLTQNIEIKAPKEMKADVQVELLSAGKVIGYLMIARQPDAPFVNVNSEIVNLGLGLTYGIGMFIDEKEAQMTMAN